MKIGIITRFGKPLNDQIDGYYYRLHYLANGLVERGHSVTVLAHPDSDIKAKLVKAKVEKIEWETQMATYANFLEKYADQFDVINAQTDHLCCFFSPFIKTPIIHTMIFGHFWDQVRMALKVFKNQYFSSISYSNKKCYPFLNWQGIIYNGLNTDQFKFNANPKDYLLFLGRVVHEKGVEDAIQIAKETKSKLIIAGESTKEYFEEKIKPKLDRNITYVGPVDFKKKIKLFREAKALLHPHLYAEGFGNSLIEAQASGTPVIAYPHGSTPEVVMDKKTGFIVKNIKEAKEALKNIDKIKREDCRKFVEDNFTIEKMVDGYEEMFKKVIVQSKKKK